MNNNIIYQSVFKSIDPFYSKNIYKDFSENILLTKFSLLIEGKDKKYLKEINNLLERKLNELTNRNNFTLNNNLL